MDLEGLNDITTKAELIAWLEENLTTPLRPAMSAADVSIILQKMLAFSNDNVDNLQIYTTITGDYTLALGDKAISTNIESANTITIPLFADQGFAPGTEILLRQFGVGQTTVVPGAGVTLLSPENFNSLRVQYSSAKLLNVSTDIWWLTGDIAAI